MGLRVIDLQVIERIRMQMPHKGRVLCLGYPDILVEMADAMELFGLKEPVAARTDLEAMNKWHGRSLKEVPESIALFKAMGYDLDVWDIHAEEGVKRVVDLNQPVEGDQAVYDLVIDCGTIEHCFNIAQAMRTIAEQVKEHGFVFHDNPCNMYNHGFYNLSPTFYHDWYENNGFVVTLCALTDGKNYLPLQAASRFKGIPDRMSIVAVARKLTHVQTAWPMQTKYTRKYESNAA